MLSHFETWYNNADIPVKQNGVWVDVETGHPYIPPKPVSRQQPTTLPNGWAVLTGSPKQIAWATAIRAQKITALAADLQAYAGTIKKAAFWIDNRELTTSALAAMLDSVMAAERDARAEKATKQKITRIDNQRRALCEEGAALAESTLKAAFMAAPKQATSTLSATSQRLSGFNMPRGMHAAVFADTDDRIHIRSKNSETRDDEYAVLSGPEFAEFLVAIRKLAAKVDRLDAQYDELTR